MSAQMILAKGGLGVPVLSADPASPINGIVWYNSTEQLFKFRQNGLTTTLGFAEISAEVVSYNNTVSELTAESVQAAIDELAGLISAQANEISNLSDAVGDAELAIEAIDEKTDDLVTLSGVPAGSENLGPFNNHIIQPATTIKDALQDLENSVASNSGGLSSLSQDMDAVAALTGVTRGSEDLGSFTGDIIPDSSSVKGALQSLETAVESIPQPIYYAGVYDADTNTPELSNSDVDVTGALYRISVAGTQDFGAGDISFEVGDSVVNNGTIWEKWDKTDNVLSVNGQIGAVSLGVADLDDVDGIPLNGQVLIYDSADSTWKPATLPSAPVSSVNGQTGAVSLDSDDIDEGSANLYFTDERVMETELDAAGSTTLTGTLQENLENTADALSALDSSIENLSDEVDTKLSAVVEDEAPVLGGNLDLNDQVVMGAMKRAADDPASFYTEEYVVRALTSDFNYQTILFLPRDTTRAVKFEAVIETNDLLETGKKEAIVGDFYLSYDGASEGELPNVTFSGSVPSVFTTFQVSAVAPAHPLESNLILLQVRIAESGYQQQTYTVKGKLTKFSV